MPETRTTAQRLQLAAANLAAALILSFIAWKAVEWGLAYFDAAADTLQQGSNSYRTRRAVASGWGIPVAIFLVAGFAALLGLGALANAAYLMFRRQD